MKIAISDQHLARGSGQLTCKGPVSISNPKSPNSSMPTHISDIASGHQLLFSANRCVGASLDTPYVLRTRTDRHGRAMIRLGGSLALPTWSTPKSTFAKQSVAKVPTK